MDFPGSAGTNIHLIDGFSTIYWRIYTEEVGIANNSLDGPANGYTILKHLGRLKDLEARLRNLNCLASCPRRLGLWVFSSTPTFERLRPLYVKEGDDESRKITVDSTTLKVSASGSISCQDLIKGLSSDSQNNGAQSAATQRPQQSQSSSRRPDGYSSSAAIYASFISAVTGAISLHLVRNHGALPLGSRTLFTAVENVGYESPRIDNGSPFSRPCLTTVNVQLITPGILTISLQTISQSGIIQLCKQSDDMANMFRVQSGTDIWLCPNGTVARLVTANIESPAASSPGNATPGYTTMKRRQWKLDVAQWLMNFGLHIESIDEEPWVEIEVWEPFFARLAGDARRQGDESQSAFSLKRMLWPARFCFKRTDPSIRSSWPQSPLEDPLEFAEKWLSNADSLKLNPPIENVPRLEEIQHKDHEMTSPRADSMENFESLSRMAQYPDLQTTNLVYPTPPDGAAAIGMSNVNTSDAYADEHDFVSPAAAPDTTNLINAGPSSNQAVGTGRYDASDDDDLFGEMNDRDFGSKGITDADFSFFDDPGLEHENIDASMDILDDTPQPALEITNADGLTTQDQALQIDSHLEPSMIAAIDRPEVHEPQIEQQNLVLADAPMGSEGSPQAPPEPASRPISPPLSPVKIKRILFPTLETDDRQDSKEDPIKQGHYHPVAFEKRLGDWNQKYGSAGKFFFASGSAPDALESTPDSIPTVGLPHRGRSRNGAIHARSLGQNASSPGLERDTRSFSASTTDSSDESDEVSSEDPSIAVALPTLKRKRVPSDSDIQSTASPAKSSAVPDGNLGLKVENCTFLGNFLANFSDWTFTGYFSALQIQQLPVLLRPEDQVPIAQILVDQITQSSLDHQLGGRIGLFGLENEIMPLRTDLENTKFLGEVAKLDLKAYASLHEDVNLASSQQQQPQNSGKGAIHRLAAPHLRIRRGKEYLEGLPPAVSFWETFGLGPAHGSKDISAYCIYPPAAAEAAEGFLSRFGLLYQSCNFGTHSRGESSPAYQQGLREWASDSSDYASMMHSLRKLCKELGFYLSQSPSSLDNRVVYIINPFPHAAALADICVAFWQLFQQLVADTNRRQARQIDDVVLQIVPMNFIISEDSMVIPAQTDYLNLALEVYNRCCPRDADSSPLLSAAAVLLVESLPKTIHFRLAADQGSPLQDGRSLHIACSKSLDQRWLSVAWSDGTGSIQTSMSYCLRYRNGGSTRMVSEVRGEIWSTTKHIMDKLQARWRVVLVHTEAVDADEVEAWTNFAEQQNKCRAGAMELTILTVSTVPELTLEPSVTPMTTSVLNAPFSSTPVSTPNPSVNIASPEQSGNAATPSAAYNALTPTEPSLEPDSDVVLADVCDESWAIVLSHRLNISPHITDFRPALVSGYLLRRKGTTDGDGVFSMTVNLVYSQRPSQSHEGILKDILGMYRDLASLARARGMRSVQGNTLPGHIATALRAQELLSYVF
ncbi:Mediator complex subunit Med13 [Penicillium hispanicum]|uniref:Mediator complex subunit Med13 n=1 Tax=Penicillium hispanicum TaxID=1080232 RepID=UPI0025406F46|nr:Mediator complex subunit Med13 [Penicillium hispanicum]KAJ5595194.1 Mediator complex subunit Med13 [Penicillium hispanicum]